MTLSYQPAGDDGIELEVRNPDNSWIGIGLTPRTDSPSMNGGGEGSDVVTCSSDGVKRFFVTSYALSGGEEVPGASCVQESGVTTLKFTRSLAADSGGRRLSQLDVTPGTSQGLIFARGDDGDFVQKYHAMSGGQSVDFSAGATPKLLYITVGVSIALVIACVAMSLCAGCMGRLSGRASEMEPRYNGQV